MNVEIKIDPSYKVKGFDLSFSGTIYVPAFVESVGNEVVASALQTGSCFGIYSAIMFPVAYITNWMEHSLKGVLYYIGIFAAIFIFVWLIQYFSVRRKINAINRKLNK